VENKTMTVPHRSRTLLAWSLWLVMFGCCAAGLVVTLALTRPITLAVLVEGAVFALIFPLAYGTIGLVLMLRRPANPIGWLYAAAGLVWSLTIPLGPWVDQLIGDHRPLPLAAQLGAVAGEFLWAPGVALSITLPFLLLPNGQLRSRRWQAVVATSVTGAAMVLGFGSVLPGRLSDQTPIANPFGLGGSPGRVVTVLFAVGLALHLGSLLAALVCVVLRFRSSVGVERQQLRWVAVGAAAAVAGLLLSTLIALGVVPRIADLIVNTALVCLPAAVSVAVLRYRLWDLDRLVSRTVTYALVTGAAGAALPAGRAGRRTAGRWHRQSRCGGRHTGCGGRIRAAAPPGPGPGRPAVQPAPLRRRPHRGPVCGPSARPGRPGRAARRAAGRGRPDRAADPGVAVATHTGGNTAIPVTAAPGEPMLACQANTQDL
jgi:hypothetical protein